jgi:hypothetical protein
MFELIFLLISVQLKINFVLFEIFMLFASNVKIVFNKQIHDYCFIEWSLRG